MSKGKVVAVVCCAAILALMMFISNPTAKTIDQFIMYYNREIENTAKDRNVSAADCLLKNVQHNSILYGTEAKKEFFSGKIAFLGNDYKEALSLGFAFDESVSSEVIFSVIEAAILASGEDYDKVARSLGILSGDKYSIRGGDEKVTTFNGKKYSVHWVDVDKIFFVIEFEK